MRSALSYFILLVIVVLSHFPQTASAEANNTWSTGDDQFLIEQPDTLMIRKAEGKREYILVSGEEFVVYYRGNHLKGIFHAMADGTLQMLVNEHMTQIPVSEITAIRLISPPNKRVFGISLMVAGASGMGISVLAAGLTIVFIGTSGSGLLAVIPLVGLSYGAIALGQHLYGKRLRIAEGHYTLLQAER